MIKINDRVLSYGYAYFYGADGQRTSRINTPKALVLCTAGHTAEHLEEIGIAEAMRRVMLQDRLLGVGVREAAMVILGGNMPGDETWHAINLARAYALGRTLAEQPVNEAWAAGQRGAGGACKKRKSTAGDETPSVGR